MLRPFFNCDKPVVITETGMRGYRGADNSGTLGFGVVDQQTQLLHSLPLVGRLIPIVADAYSDPEKGTGAVKITPAHDFNDFEVGKRHGLPLVNVLDAEARVIVPSGTEDNTRKAFDGRDRFFGE